METMEPTSTPLANDTSATMCEKLTQGRFVLTIEMVPPRTPDLDSIYKRLGKFFAGQADAINVTDCASAIVRMTSMCASHACIQAGYEPVMQITCRDRNRIALQAELISAYAMGIRNVLCLSGDHVRFGDHPTAKPVFDLDSTNLLAVASRMRAQGMFCSGEPIRNTAKAEPFTMDWLLGAAANPYGNKPAHLALHMDKKRRAGADFLQTQPIYDLEGFARWWKALEEYDLPRKMKILPGILPPKSARALEFMSAEVPGVYVPEALIKRMKGAEDAAAEGRKIALELIEGLMAYPIAGIHYYPVMWESLIPELAPEIRKHGRESYCKTCRNPPRRQNGGPRAARSFYQESGPRHV